MHGAAWTLTWYHELRALSMLWLIVGLVNGLGLSISRNGRMYARQRVGAFSGAAENLAEGAAAGSVAGVPPTWSWGEIEEGGTLLGRGGGRALSGGWEWCSEASC